MLATSVRFCALTLVLSPLLSDPTMAPLTNLECSAWRDAPQSQDMDHRRQQSYTISKAARSQAEEPTFPLAKDGDAQQQQQHLVTNHFSNLHLSPDIPNRTAVTSSWTAYDSAASRDQGEPHTHSFRHSHSLRWP